MFDILFVKGKIYTMEREGECFQSIGIRKGKIEFIGSDEEAEKYSAKKVVDLEGKTMIPGMADSHLHLYAYCQNLTFVDLSQVGSLEEMIEVMKKRAAETPKGEWIKGVNFDQTKWSENRFPTLGEMDDISTEHPVIIKRCCLHAVVEIGRAHV